MGTYNGTVHISLLEKNVTKGNQGRETFSFALFNC